MDETANVTGKVTQVIEEEPKVTQETTDGTANSAKAMKKKATPAEQDQQMAEEIAQAGTMLAAIKADPVILAALATYGTDAAEIAVGEALQGAAQDRFTDRQGALALEGAKTAAGMVQLAQHRTHYADFREVCRARITDPKVKQALSITGTIPQDRQKFLTQARAAYGEAAKPLYQPIVSKIGFGPDVLAARLAGLEAFNQTLAEIVAASAAAKGATAARNDAVKALRQWVAALKRIARRALRTRPDLASKLGI